MGLASWCQIPTTTAAMKDRRARTPAQAAQTAPHAKSPAPLARAAIRTVGFHLFSMATRL
jgi:hypothetical protein